MNSSKNAYKCPVTATMKVIGGKWKPIILWNLNEGTMRFGELKKRMGDITQKMLTSQLRELEKDRIILRKVYAIVPPKVEYSLTPLGKSLNPVMKSMSIWGKQFQEGALPKL